jgi:hypothetical protein
MKVLKLLKHCIVINVLFISISCTPNECVGYGYSSQFDYDIDATEITNGGIHVDTSNNTIDLSKIDRLTDEVELCLIEEFGNPPLIPEEVMMGSGCLINTFDIPLPRECLTVKIPDDWVWSCDGTQQLLPYEAPQKLCDEKGLDYNLSCPCRWRGGIQNDHVIVTTPNMVIYKDSLIRMMTSCNNPWAHTKLSNCANK